MHICSSTAHPSGFFDPGLVLSKAKNYQYAALEWTALSSILPQSYVPLLFILNLRSQRFFAVVACQTTFLGLLLSGLYTYSTKVRKIDCQHCQFSYVINIKG